MITGYICDITISIEVLRDRRKVFSGFIVRSIVSRAMSVVYPKLFERAHDKRMPSLVYLSPLEDIERGIYIERITEDNIYRFRMTSLRVNVDKIARELLETSYVELKDYRVEILEYFSMNVPIKPIKIKEEELISLTFRSPASFRITPLKGRLKESSYFPFPRPDLLVKNIIRTIREGCEGNEKLEEILSSWDPNTIRLVDFHNAKTRVYYDFNRRPYVAFKGSFHYEIRDPEPYNILFSVAKVTGVGAWRFSGFGRVDVDVLSKDHV